MNSHLKKIIVLPFALLFLFVSTFFLTGCLCATPRSEIVQSNIDITNTSINNPKFRKLIGRSSKTATRSTLSDLLITSILGNEEATDDFKKKLKTKANMSTSGINDFQTDYEKSDSTYTKATFKITDNSPKDLSLKFDKKNNKTETFKAPSDWNQITDQNKVKITSLILELEFSSDEKDSKSTPNKYKIQVKFTDTKFKFNENFVMSNNREDFEKGTVTIESITKITT